MKKTYITSLLLLLFTLPVSAQVDDEMCIQKTQVAVDRYGNCQEFSTPCDVPDNWTKKPVTSCDEVEKIEQKKAYNKVTERRRRSFNAYLRNKSNEAAEDKPEKRQSGGSRFGKAYATNEFLRRETTGTSKTDYTSRRTYSRKKITAANIQKYQKYRGKGTNIQLHRSKTSSTRPNIRSSAYSAKREGALKNEPNVYQRQEDRFRSTNYGTRSPYWKSYQQQRADKRAKNKKEYVPRTVRLRKTYRGNTDERRAADLSSSYVKETPSDLLPGNEDE